MKLCLRCQERAPEPSRFCPACGASLQAAGAPREQRKIVTVLFADVVGSTALGERVDPETLRWAMQQWFTRMRDVVERHGGMVENYVGDAVMAVFGIPVVRADDALRGVRAASQMRDEVSVLAGELRERGVDLTMRIGVNTGEAVTGASLNGGFFTAGDMVNVAARLEQSAQAGQVLIGVGTHRLVRHAADAEEVEALTVKGKSGRVQAFALRAVAADAPPRPERPRAPLVGRRQELQALTDAFERAHGDERCQLALVLGAPGVGKSRLVADLVGGLSERATIVRGQCQSSGEGLTWRPLRDPLNDLLDDVQPREPAASACVAELVGQGRDAITPEDAFWAVRTVLETATRTRPVVCVIDDVQWAEPTLRDLLEHVADHTHGALLLVLIARSELLEDRPSWAERTNATPVLVEPLLEEEAAGLVEHLLGSADLDSTTVARMLSVSGGNPLYLVELVAMLVDDGLLDGAGGTAEFAIPLTIRALLAERLDRLVPAERAVIEAASIAGVEFEGERLAALLGSDRFEALDDALRTLVRRDLVERDDSGEGRLRFTHQLIRDAAYETIPKHTRAELHERFAASLTADPGAASVVDEALGYHRERAVLLRRELGESEAATADLAGRAARSLAAAGRRARYRSDSASANGLLGRAVALLRTGDAQREALLPVLGTSLYEAGRMADAVAILEQAITGDAEPRVRALAEVEREFVRLDIDTTVGTLPARTVTDRVLPVFERAGDLMGQSRAWSLRAKADWWAGHAAQADAAWERAAICARRAGDEREVFSVLGWRALAAVFGPTPVDEAIARCEGYRATVAASPVREAWIVGALAALHAMRGDLAGGVSFVEDTNAILEEFGDRWESPSHIEAVVRLLAGQPERAEQALRADAERLVSTSEDLLATTQAMLAQAVYEQGRWSEAEELCRAAAAIAGDDDIVTQVVWRSVSAKVLARDGHCTQAEALAREALALVQDTDLLTHSGEAMLDLAEVLQTCARNDREALALTEKGIALLRRKGNTTAITHAQCRISQSARRRSACH